MVERLHIENFQAHRDLDIKLDPHVTTIIGPSDVGKSSIIRAITWLATNKPAGRDFIREGADKAVVTLTIDDIDIVRTRGKSLNEYRRGGNVYKAFGNDVPPDVSELLNLDSINFQGQHDAPFWFSETAGEVSRQLNDIVDLGIIDRTLAALDSKLRDARAGSRMLVEQVAEAKSRRSGLAWARKAEKDMVTLDKTHKMHHTAHAYTTRLAEMVEAIEGYTKKKNTLGAILRGITDVVEKGDVWETLNGHRKYLMRLAANLVIQQEIIDREIPDTAPLDVFLKTLQKTKNRARALQGDIRDLEYDERNLLYAERAAITHQNEFDTQMKKEGVCPLCQSKL